MILTCPCAVCEKNPRCAIALDEPPGHRPVGFPLDRYLAHDSEGTDILDDLVSRSPIGFQRPRPGEIMMELRVFADAATLAEQAAALIASRIKDGATTLGLAGGNTPKATYEQLRHQDIPWDRVVAWLPCLLYTSDAADDLLCVDLGGRRIIKKK